VVCTTVLSTMTVNTSGKRSMAGSGESLVKNCRMRPSPSSSLFFVSAASWIAE
jgi:hypothetical protein